MSVQPAALYWADPCISDTWPTGLLHLAWNTQPLNGFAFNTNTTNTNTNGTNANTNTWPIGLLHVTWKEYPTT